jgi:hypothetical protein
LKIVRRSFPESPVSLGYIPGDRGTPAWLVEYREKIRGRWFYMVCGHGSDIIEQERYGAFRPKKIKDKYWCETCGKWQKKKPPPPPVVYPDDPAELF